jgi:hypothetical protein
MKIMMKDRTSFWFDSITYDSIKSDYKAVKQDFNYYIKDKQLRSPVKKVESPAKSIGNFTDFMDNNLTESVRASSVRLKDEETPLNMDATRSMYVDDIPAEVLEELGYDSPSSAMNKRKFTTATPKVKMINDGQTPSEESSNVIVNYFGKDSEENKSVSNYQITFIGSDV